MFWQGTLGLAAEPVVRHHLDEWSWLDHGPGWLPDADSLFAELAEALPWRQRRVRMYDRMVDEPRLVWWAQDPAEVPLPRLAAMARRLGEAYGIELDSVSANFYRDGHDSVAWHADRIRHHAVEPLVAIVTLGGGRPFLLRPAGGGPSQRFCPRSGDLLVMGGACQHRWHHAVPKVAEAGPRISVMFRHWSDIAPEAWA